MLEQVTKAAPDFAEGHTALAEALVLSREFGGRSDEAAFIRARAAARAAMRLAPEQADGHRIMGFIAYWADRDFAEAETRFRRALALAPDDVQTHFWFGNVLSHYGRHTEALGELDRARLMSPGSVAIRTDHAWAMWAAGKEADALTALQDIASRYRDFVVVQDCLATLSLTRADNVAYVRHFAAFARLRGEPGLIARAQSLESAAARDAAALSAEIVQQARAELARPQVFDRALAALVLTRAGSRDGVVKWARQLNGEAPHWGSDGMTDRLRQAWRGDRQLLTLLAPSPRPRRARGVNG